jgi:hypothetical protein
LSYEHAVFAAAAIGFSNYLRALHKFSDSCCLPHFLFLATCSFPLASASDFAFCKQDDTLAA